MTLAAPVPEFVAAQTGSTEPRESFEPRELSPAPAADPHAPKLSPDDPRLRLRRPMARTLRMGPLVVLGVVLLAALMAAVAMAFQTPARSSGARADASGSPAAPTVPETIRNAASASPPPPAAPRGGEAPATGAQNTARSEMLDEEKLRRLEDMKAQNSGILFESAAAPAFGGGGLGPEPPPRGAEFATNAPPPGGPPSSGETDPNFQDRKNAFVDGQGSAKSTDTLRSTLQHPRSPYEIKAGTIIPTVLITAINSDLPGPVIGQVRENVYDTVSGNFLLVPQGARLLANYDSMVAWGQERVLLCWNRLILPNGDSLNLQCMPAADLEGAAGLTDQVDEHWFRIIKGAAVASLLAATTTAVAGNTDGFQPTVPQMWARGAAGDINQAGQQITRRNLMIQPTITVRPGYSVNVIVTKDMILPPYPEPAPIPGLAP
jgi:type IV secretory pathway VirB10-like protein